MSVFKRFNGKKISPDSPDWERGTWYMWQRIGKGKAIHKSLRGIETEEEALRAECDIMRTVAKHAEEKHAIKIAKRLSKTTDPDKTEYLYILESGGHFKIGRTTDIPTRLKSITKTIIPFRTQLIFAVAIKGASIAEKMIHAKFSDKRVKGEWFIFTEYELREVKLKMIDF